MTGINYGAKYQLKNLKFSSTQWFLCSQIKHCATTWKNEWMSFQLLLIIENQTVQNPDCTKLSHLFGSLSIWDFNIRPIFSNQNCDWIMKIMGEISDESIICLNPQIFIWKCKSNVFLDWIYCFLLVQNHQAKSIFV